MPLNPADPRALTLELKQAARRLGFSEVGVCLAQEPPGWPRFQDWLAAGHHGEMHYLSLRRDAYRHPSSILPSVRSVVMLTLDYRSEEPPQILPGQGRVSRYAWGERDYHDVIRDKLHALADHLRLLAPEAETRGIVDTAPLLERDFARAAGIGWQGKNTLLLSRKSGSWFFLAALLTSADLEPDAPHLADHCGTCRACLDACPTEAFPAAGVLDARRCVSYLTIELRGPIPRELREGIGDRVFGCDDCQEVCPWQSKSQRTAVIEFEPDPALAPLDLIGLFTLDEAGFRRRFRRTPLWRAHREGLLRNAAIVLGNQKHREAEPALISGLQDASPVVRGACVWALSRLESDSARAALQARLTIEEDPHVLDELKVAGFGSYPNPAD